MGTELAGGDRDGSSALAGLLQVAADAGLGALAWRVGRSPTLGNQVRRPWRLIGGAAAFTAAGDLAVLLAPVAGLEPSAASTAWFAAASLLLLLGLVTFPLGPRSRLDVVTAMLDGSIVVIGGAIAVWVILVMPGTEAGLSPGELLVASLGPMGGLLCLVGAARLAVNPHRESHPLPIILLVLGLLGFFGESLGKACDLALGEGWPVAEAVLAFLGTVLVAAAAHLQSRTHPARGELDREAYGPFLVHARAALPYTAVAVGFWFPLDAASSGRTDQFFGLVCCAATLTVLIIARQVAVLEHRRLVAGALRASEARYRELLEHVPTVVYVSDFGPDGAWRYVSPRVEELLGFTAQEWTRDRGLWWSRLHPDDRDRVQAEELESWMIPSSERSVVEYRMLTRDGRVRWVRDEATVVRDGGGSPAYWSGFLTDITDQKSLEEQLQHQAFHDPLTGLANRAVFIDRVEHALSRSRRGPARLAILFLDLDNFKTINDGMGHAAGDALLVAVGARLLTCLRPGDTAARLGGDEFAILLEETADDDAPRRVAERIHEALARPVTIQGREIVIGTSIGITTSTARGEGAAELLRNADAAMYVAKRTGTNRTQVFEPTMHAAAVRRLELNVDMRRATELEEFTVHYQPVVRLDDGSVVGLEALIRWNHPTRGLVGPNEFITLAEETGLIVAIGRMVLERACRELRTWQDAVPGGAALTVSVNVSARQLQDGSFVASVADALDAASLDPSSLILEITESVVMADADAAVDRLGELKALGVRLAIDDFGTGYSSLGYLRRLPVDTLKVDRSLIAGVDDDRDALSLAEMVLRLGRTFRLQTIAEGVERESQARALRGVGFELAQGYRYSRPIPPEAVVGILRGTQRPEGTDEPLKTVARLTAAATLPRT